ncbi:kinase-like protein [Auricularia subglabra TFB-10046 SS5]|nr:kinase-like protein [Auricularia subglabra TFB-10046 SS5]
MDAMKTDHAETLSAIARGISAKEPIPANLTPVRLESTLKPHKLDDTLRLLQLRLRMYDNKSTQYAAVQTALRELQQCAGNPLLHLADLVGEASKLGIDPVHVSSTSEIWRGIWLGDEDTRVALKCLHTHTPRQSSTVMRFHRQIEFIRRVQHDNVIRLYGVCYVDGPWPYLVFPWMKHGNVLNFLSDFPNADRLQLILDVARGLAHLHAQDPPMVHRALEPGNILVDDNHSAVLGGFGLAKALECLQGETAYSVSDPSNASMRWMAPEVAKGNYSAAADVYAWAMTALRVLSDMDPFHRYSKTQTSVQIVRKVQQGTRPGEGRLPQPQLYR